MGHADCGHMASSRDGLCGNWCALRQAQQDGDRDGGEDRVETVRGQRHGRVEVVTVQGQTERA